LLPLPNLDDRTFEQLVREARDLIPSIFPEWTDENEHDPGITLLELLAWHIEMQQFRLDQLTDNHERKFLKLLGVAPKDRVPAMTSVSFSGAKLPILIPYGTLLHVGQLPFETVRPVTVLPDSTKRVYVNTSETSSEISDDFESGSAPFYPFGEDCKPGAAMVIEMEEPLPTGKPISLWIQLADQEPDHRIPARYTEFIPSAKVTWKYWDPAGGGSWQPIELERDESYGLHQSGPILFQLPEGADSVTRIKSELEAGEYNDPPHIRRLIWNEVFVKQGETLCITECFDGVGEAGSTTSYELRHALFQNGSVSVQFKIESGGWIDIPNSQFSVIRSGGRAFMTFAEGISLPQGSQSIRAIAVSESFADRTMCGRGNGISGQVCPIVFLPMLPDQLRLQVGWPQEGTDKIVWHDWDRVHDFDGSSSDSFHYVIDEEEGLIRFSDGVHGAVPPFSLTPNIRMIGFRTGTGQAGNVKANTITEIDPAYGLQVTNLYPAYGGAEPETIKDAFKRARLQILEPRCGVTAEDLEKRVKEIPGLRIARVKTIPSYKPSLLNYPEERAFGHISVVIVPYSKRYWPKPSEGLRQTVRRHLEPYRLLTTTLHIIPPEYVKVTVRAIIVVDPRYEGRETMVRQALNRWLRPYGDDLSIGWEFGRPIYKSDVYDIIHRVPGVLYIQDVWLMADGKDAYREEGGDIRIPPNGLVFSGEHEIEFVTST
jgi:hypothetical protein